jgi:hypothetical protein
VIIQHENLVRAGNELYGVLAEENGTKGVDFVDKKVAPDVANKAPEPPRRISHFF